MPTLDTEARQTVERLIEAGSHYRLDALEELYHPDLRIVMVDAGGGVQTFDYDENLAFFRARRDAGEPPLGTGARFDYVWAEGDDAQVIVTREMGIGEGLQTLVFSLDLVRVEGAWRIRRELAVAR